MQRSRRPSLICCLCLALLCSMLPSPSACVTAQFITSGNPTAPQKNRAPRNQNTARNLAPTTGGAPRSLPGTAWKIDFGKGVTGTVFLFCKGGKRWEIVPQRAGTIGAVGKAYSVSGDTLTTVNADDGMVQKWKMTWEGEVLAINDGKVTLRLHYNGETQCK